MKNIYRIDFNDYVEDVEKAILYIFDRMSIPYIKIEKGLYSVELEKEEKEIFDILFEEYFYSGEF